MAMTAPTNAFAMDDIKFMTGYNVEPVVASETAVVDAIQKYYPFGAGVQIAMATTRGSALEMASKGLEELQASLDTNAEGVEVLDELHESIADALARQGEEAPVVRQVNVVLMSAIQKGASDIHVEPASLAKFESAILRPCGMVLVTEPTGSRKTNTLCSAISQINTTETNIITAEDPVEFNLVGINQVQVRENIGRSFAAALTGHLVLSTLHTNDAPSTVNRLMNMGIEPFLVANSVNLICAQRLVRWVCSKCKEPPQLPPSALIQAGFAQDQVDGVQPMKGAGCQRCKGEFNWSSQHLDDAVLRWRNGTGDGQTEQVSLRCVRPVARGERGGRSHNGSGRRPPGGCRVKRPRCPVACRRPWVVVGSVRAVGCRRSAWRRRRLVPCPVRSGRRSQSSARRAPGCATVPVGFVEPRRLSHEHGVATRRLDAAVWRIGRRLRRGTAPDVPSGRREPSWPRPIACGAPCRTASQARSGLRTGGPCLAQT